MISAAGSVLEFFRRESPLLVEDRIGHSDLAHVVQQARKLDGLELVVAEMQLGPEPPREHGDALGMTMGVAIFRVDRCRDGADGIEQKPFELSQQTHAVQRDPSLVPDRRQQFEVGLVEAPGAARAVGVERAENLVGGAERYAHHRPDVLQDDALPFSETIVRNRVMREHRDSLLDDVAHQRATDRERCARRRPRPCGCHFGIAGIGADPPKHQRSAIGSRHLQNRAQRRVRQPGDVARHRQQLRHSMQGRQMPLGSFEQQDVWAMPSAGREPLELRGLEFLLDHRFECPVWRVGQHRFHLAAYLVRPDLQHAATDTHDVADARDAVLDLPFVDVGAVGGSQVGHHQLVSARLEHAVSPRHRLVVEMDLALRCAPCNQLLPFRRVDHRTRGAGEDLEMEHRKELSHHAVAHSPARGGGGERGTS
jgi:hypothetical protein